MRQAKSVCLTVAAGCLAVGAAFAPAAHAAGEIWRWKDANGIWHYADQPVPGAELISGVKPTTPRPPAAPATGTTPPGANAPAGSVGVDRKPPPVSAQVAQQVRAEADAARSQQCEKAREAYNLAIQSRRMFRVGANGEREYLDEAEADTARLNARAEMDSVCGGN